MPDVQGAPRLPLTLMVNWEVAIKQRRCYPGAGLVATRLSRRSARAGWVRCIVRARHEAESRRRVENPRWTAENRQFVDTAKPAIVPAGRDGLVVRSYLMAATESVWRGSPRPSIHHSVSRIPM